MNEPIILDTAHVTQQQHLAIVVLKVIRHSFSRYYITDNKRRVTRPIQKGFNARELRLHFNEGLIVSTAVLTNTCR